jgi:hypothetical protein
MSKEIPVPESAALIAFRKTQCTEANLFDVPYPVRGYITLQISKARINRSTYDVYHMNEEELIEVKMSYSQFAEAITNMNIGCGIPCTLNYLNGKKIPDIESQIHEIDLFEDDIVDNLESIYQKLHDIKQTISSSKMAKGTQSNLMIQCNQLGNILKDRLPFIEKVYLEKLSKLKSKLKTDIASWVEHLSILKGIDAIKNLKVLEPASTEDKNSED